MKGGSSGSGRSLAEIIAKSGLLPEAVTLADLTILNEALTSLFARLREASTLYRDVPDDGRWGTIVTLRAMAEFLLRFQPIIADELYLPLFNLASALVSLEFNNVAPILRRIPRSGRAPDSVVRQVMVGTAVGAVKQLQFIGIDAAAARKAVAATLVKQGIKPTRGKGQISIRTIREWCERVDADTAAQMPTTKEAARMMSEKWQRRLASIPQPEAREEVLRNFSESIRRAESAGANN
jgi:hypothetical protein